MWQGKTGLIGNIPVLVTFNMKVNVKLTALAARPASQAKLPANW
jgi:hypothetical protein